MQSASSDDTGHGIDVHPIAVLQKILEEAHM